MDEPRRYTGWKAGLTVVFATVAVVTALNLAIQAMRPERAPREPGKVVTTVTPSR